MKRTIATSAAVLGLVGSLVVLAAEHPPHHKAQAVMADAKSPPTQAPTTTTSTTTVPTTTVPPTTTPPTTAAPAPTSVLPAKRTIRVRVQSVGPATPVATTPPQEGDLSFPPECLSGSYWESFHDIHPKIAAAHACWDQLLQKYPWDSSHAFSVMMCESEGNPTEVNRSGATGLMQVIMKGASTEPNQNMRQAYYDKYVSAGNSWGPWSPSSSCSSRKQKG